jgi:hypothetical protein
VNHGLAKSLEGKVLLAGLGGAELDVARVLAVASHPEDDVFGVEAAWCLFRLAHGRLGEGCGNRGANVEAGLGPGVDNADVLEEAIGVDDGGHANFKLAAELPHAGDAVSRTENPVGDEGADLARNLLIKGGAVFHPVFIDVAHNSTVHRFLAIQAPS